MHSSTILGLSALFCLVFLGNGCTSKKSHEKTKMEKDQLRASIGAARDALVGYVTNPGFSVTSEMVIDKIVDFMSEMDAEDLKEVSKLLQTNPTLMKKLSLDLKSDIDEDDNVWSDPEKTYELLRSGLQTFSQMEDTKEYFQKLIKIIGQRTKDLIMRDEL